MNRDDMLAAAETERVWDVLVVGGGATGLGAAVEAATRGHRTLLLEASDFAKGSSSRSTKLIHGDVRYPRQDNVPLVLEALRERGLLMRNAPHLVHDLAFVVPIYDGWQGPFYGIGLKMYDVLAGRLGLGPSRRLSREEALSRIPGIKGDGLRGGIVYHDGQFDDARLAITLARTAAGHGAALLNHCPVTGLLKEDGWVRGVVARDEETGREFELRAHAVVNATGVFADAVRRMDAPGATPTVAPSQGAHIVLDRAFQPGDSAIMVPETSDGRVLFAVPWHGRVVVGTTDTPRSDIVLEPRPFEEEIDFLLEHAARYLERDPGRSDVLSAFAGLRPRVRSDDGRETASLSRDHTLDVSASGLITITGGKWTTYRKMGEEVVELAAQVGGLDEKASITTTLRLHGWTDVPAPHEEAWSVYGADAPELERLARGGLERRLHPRLPYGAVEVVWAARHEMARTVEDVLARRTRALLLDARASIDAAPEVARILAAELKRDDAWQHAQVEAYRAVAAGYLLA